MNKLLKSGTLACLLLACMAGGQSAATSPTGTNMVPQNMEELLAAYDDVQIRRPSAIAAASVRTVKSGDYTLITGTEVRAAIHGLQR
ncbi:MAG: hypothetical protein AAFY73_08590 [Pseudomonadota bacterium]